MIFRQSSLFSSIIQSLHQYKSWSGSHRCAYFCLQLLGMPDSLILLDALLACVNSILCKVQASQICHLIAGVPRS